MSLDPTLQPETDYTGFINESGELEIEYIGQSHHPYGDGSFPVDLSVTVSYKVWSIDTEGAECEYSIIGSSNYLPSDFDQLVIDYIKELEVMKNVSIYKITRV
jgi:hypothetical protein